MKKIKHGEHNRTLCDHLITKGGYNDWVVTTAFYSAIHFIEHKLFDKPFDYGGKKLINIDAAHNYIRITKSKHETRGILVTHANLEFAHEYLYLEKACKNARYINY